MKIFVYGTLRQGFNNHSLLTNIGAEFIGDAKTVDSYHLSAAGIPYVSAKLEPSCPVVGEVYAVRDTHIDWVDSLEGHPNWYERKEIQAVYTGDEAPQGEAATVWLYFNEEDSGEYIPTGDYKDYDYD